MGNCRQAGFTLLELLISMTLLVVFLMGMITVFESNRATYSRGEWTMEAQQAGRMAVGELSQQLRMAGYFPENFTNPPAFPRLQDGIHVATNTAIAVRGDIEGTGASQLFLYCWDGNNLRRISGPLGNATSYTCAAGDVLASNISAFQFVYYDEDHDAIESPAAPFQLDGQALGVLPTFADTTERDQVRRVVATFTVTEQVPQQDPQNYELSADILLRNIW